MLWRITAGFDQFELFWYSGLIDLALRFRRFCRRSLGGGRLCRLQQVWSKLILDVSEPNLLHFVGILSGNLIIVEKHETGSLLSQTQILNYKRNCCNGCQSSPLHGNVHWNHSFTKKSRNQHRFFQYQFKIRRWIQPFRYGGGLGIWVQALIGWIENRTRIREINSQEFIFWARFHAALRTKSLWLLWVLACGSQSGDFFSSALSTV